MRLFVTPLARSDVDQIYDLIAADRPSAARRWIDRMQMQFKFLSRNPRVGTARDDIRPHLRSISFGDCVIYFRERDDALEIVRVIHGARDIDQLF